MRKKPPARMQLEKFLVQKPEYRIAGYFRGVYISGTANSILVRESNFMNGDTEPRLLLLNYLSRFLFSRIGCAFAKFAK